MNLESLGRFLVATAVVLFVLGLMLILLGRVGILRLPGDLLVRRGNSTFFFPIATSLVVSLVLTVLINLLLWLWRR